MRADENVMRSLFQGRDVSGAATSCPVPESAVETDPIEICCNRWEVMIGDCGDLVHFQKGPASFLGLLTPDILVLCE